MNPQSAVLAANVGAAGNGAAVNWLGGIADFIAVGTPASAQVQIYDDASASWVPFGSAIVAAGITLQQYCPAGAYRVAITGTPTAFSLTMRAALS